MKQLTILFGFILLLSSSFLWSVSPGDSRNNRNSSNNDKEYLFPGTGFFKKNRDPLDDKQAKLWFLEAEQAEAEGDSGDALSLYENFSKRRSDYRIIRKGNEIQIGPESLYRAANLREKKGDWQKAFQHLRLIAELFNICVLLQRLIQTMILNELRSL